MNCSECKRKLSKQVVKIAKGLGAKKVIGRCCGPNTRFLTSEKALVRDEFLNALFKIIKRNNKTFKKFGN
ncbi:MAG: hypothetical protein Q7S81_01755 [bacterium]|jgi:hypothetical protein|nr:hypothetical protein [bacterium]